MSRGSVQPHYWKICLTESSASELIEAFKDSPEKEPHSVLVNNKFASLHSVPDDHDRNNGFPYHMILLLMSEAWQKVLL